MTGAVINKHARLVYNNSEMLTLILHILYNKLIVIVFISCQHRELGGSADSGLFSPAAEHDSLKTYLNK